MIPAANRIKFNLKIVGFGVMLLGMVYVILMWHSLSFPYNYFACGFDGDWVGTLDQSAMNGVTFEEISLSAFTRLS